MEPGVRLGGRGCVQMSPQEPEFGAQEKHQLPASLPTTSAPQPSLPVLWLANPSFLLFILRTTVRGGAGGSGVGQLSRFTSHQHSPRF